MSVCGWVGVRKMTCAEETPTHLDTHTRSPTHTHPHTHTRTNTYHGLIQ